MLNSEVDDRIQSTISLSVLCAGTHQGKRLSLESFARVSRAIRFPLFSCLLPDRALTPDVECIITSSTHTVAFLAALLNNASAAHALWPEPSNLTPYASSTDPHCLWPRCFLCRFDDIIHSAIFIISSTIGSTPLRQRQRCCPTYPQTEAAKPDGAEYTHSFQANST